MTDQLPSGAFERPSPRDLGASAPDAAFSFQASFFEPRDTQAATSGDDTTSSHDGTSGRDASAADASVADVDTSGAAAPQDAGPDGERRPRRRRRGGRGRRRNRTESGDGDSSAAPQSAGDDETSSDAPVLDESAVSPPRDEDTFPADPQAATDSALEPAHAPAGDELPDDERGGRRRRRRGRRGGRRHARDRQDRGPDADADAVEAPVDATVAALDGTTAEFDELDAAVRAPVETATDDDAARESEPRDAEQHGERDEGAREDQGDDRRRSRRRRGRRGRGRGGRADDRQRSDAAQPRTEDAGAAASEGEEAEVEERAPDAGAQRPTHERGGETRGRGRRRRRGRGRDRDAAPSAGPVEVELIPGEDDELPGAAHAKAAASSAARDEFDDDVPRVKPGKKNVILVNAADREETRVAVVVDGQIVDFLMHVKRHEMLVNDIYRGKVVNLEPAIGAAFVDFGQGRNGFLHTSDVLSAYGEEDWSLDKLLTTKIDPEEWDEKSSQPDVGAELTSGNGDGEAPAAQNGEEAAAPERERSHRRKHHGGGRMRARPRLPITDLLEKSQSVVVQVTKDAIGDKGPTLTTYISIPGRYLVLMPSMARTGVSRKIEDEKERRRLKRILESLDIPQGMGVIVRTAGIGCSRQEIQRDLDYLLLLWSDFGKRLNLGRGPVALYEESDVAIRTIRDLFNDHTEAVIVDDERVYNRVRDFVTKLMPEKLDVIKLHPGVKPLFHTHNVEQDFERMFARRIDLPSGGSIVFDQAEALVAIDVNSGKTRTDGFDFEEVALRTNLDAVKEIARQIRLRDLGGIIVCDFIDMQRGSARRQVERALRDALATDRARSKLGRISQFGLLELTRQRLGPGLAKMLFHNCSRCRGSGKVRSVESRVGAILRRLGSALTLKGFTKVEVRAAPEVIEALKRNHAQELRDLGIKHEREVELVSVSDQLEDSVLRYLRTDGREVRPGGRRKR